MSATPLTCAECGERIVRGRSPGTFSHVSRLVAACDLNSDHPAEPDWALVGEMPCRSCGEAVIRAGGGFAHVDASRDDDHRPDPVLPAG
jgi:ribosomal protein S27E